MNPLQVLTLANAAAGLLQALLPQIHELLHQGEITPEQQNELLAKIEALRDGTAFDGPQWQPDPPDSGTSVST